MEFANKNLQGDEIAKTTYLQSYNICSVVRTDDIDIVLFLSKCKIKIFPWILCPHWAMEQQFAH